MTAHAPAAPSARNRIARRGSTWNRLAARRDERRLEADEQHRDRAQRELRQLELADGGQWQHEEQQVGDEGGPRRDEHELAGEAHADGTLARVPEPEQATASRAGQVRPRRPESDQRAGAAPRPEQPGQGREAEVAEDGVAGQEQDQPHHVEPDGVGGVVAADADEAGVVLAGHQRKGHGEDDEGHGERTREDTADGEDHCGEGGRENDGGQVPGPLIGGPQAHVVLGSGQQAVARHAAHQSLAEHVRRGQDGEDTERAG